MKNIKLSSIVLPVLIALTMSCSDDLLNVDPVAQELSGNYYQTEDQVYASLIGAYDPLAWSMAFGQWISPVMFGEIRSDNANAGGNSANDDQVPWQEIDDFSEKGNNGLALPIYRRGYIGIARANAVLENVTLDTDLVKQYKAEAKFLRAFYHFDLFKNFGPIPVVDRLMGTEENGLKRNTMSEVFTAIEADLMAAIPELPITYPSDQTGRATKGAAMALLGKAYLYWADFKNDDAALFDKAAEQFENVIALNQYDLVPNYADLWAYGAKNTVESVFEYQHSNLYAGDDWGWFEGIEGNGMVVLCGIRGFTGDHPIYKPGWGFMMPTQSLYDTYLADEDSRKNSTVISEADLDAEVGGTAIVDKGDVNPFDYEGFWQIKYANYKAYDAAFSVGNPDLTKGANVPVIRLADVYLMLAEALVRGTGTEAEATPYVDMVRARAGVSDVATVMAAEGWSFMDVLDYERRVELAIEGHRWFDLVRAGKVDGSLFDAEKAANLTENSLWLPISDMEMQLTTGLTQYPTADLFN